MPAHVGYPCCGFWSQFHHSGLGLYLVSWYFYGAQGSVTGACCLFSCVRGRVICRGILCGTSGWERCTVSSYCTATSSHRDTGAFVVGFLWLSFFWVEGRGGGTHPTQSHTKPSLHTTLYTPPFLSLSLSLSLALSLALSVSYPFSLSHNHSPISPLYTMLLSIVSKVTVIYTQAHTNAGTLSIEIHTYRARGHTYYCMVLIHNHENVFNLNWTQKILLRVIIAGGRNL